ncbi:MAG TPA: nuclear transport factor 2 family protein [Solirubrobacterales bacterium]|nr:nuclear transport factor 2 family protein [Solirubrobacterales bacterium]
MSEEANLALVRRIYEAWEAGRFGDVSWADPELEFEIAGGPDQGVYSGLGAMDEAFTRWLNEFEGFRVEATGIEARGDVVLTAVRFHGRAKTSGVPLEGFRGSNLFFIRDGRVVRLELHMDSEGARRRFEEH